MKTCPNTHLNGRLAILMAISGLVTQSAVAVLIAVDTFDYLDGANLGGLAGGSGWTDGWVAPGDTNLGTVISSLNGVSTAKFDNLNSFTTLTTNTAAYRMFPEQTGDSLYISYTFAYTGSSVNFSALWFDRTPEHSTHNAGRLNMGIVSSSGQLFTGLLTTAENRIFTDTYAVPDTFYTMVVHLYKSVPGATEGYNAMEVWINPAFAESGTPQYSLITSTGIPNIDKAGWRFASQPVDTDLHVAELIIGTAWGDVVPVPEPGSIAAVLGLAVLAGVMFRRIRRS
jgi:hypothetical protein